MRSDCFCSELPIPRHTSSTSFTFHHVASYPVIRRTAFVQKNIRFCPKLLRESGKSRHVRMFQEQWNLFILKRRKIFRTSSQRRLAEKKRMAPYVYPHVHCKTTFIAPLILIGLSILLVCDTTEIMMNRSLILVIDVA